MNAIEVDALHVEYRSGFWKNRIKVGLAGLTLRVPEHEVVGLLGPNGAGKTTTIKSILGLARPKSGTVRIFGEPVTHSAVRKRLGFLPEQPYFYDHLTSRELLGYYAQLSGIGAAQINSKIGRALERVRLED